LEWFVARRGVESQLKIDVTRGIPNAPPHYNGAPGQDYLVIRVHPENEDFTLDLIRWGLLPSWAKDRKMAWKMINARPETVSTMHRFRHPALTLFSPLSNRMEW
jgi:putative SOS response-associated peptidase YedK